MANLNKTKTLFAFTSPRTIEKIIPEIDLLISSFKGQLWNSKLQTEYFKRLFKSKFYYGDKIPKDPALAARDRITRAPKALGFVDLKPHIDISKAGEKLLEGKRLNDTFTRQLLKFQLPSPYHTKSRKIEFNVKPYLELLRLIKAVDSLSKTEIAIFFMQLTHHGLFDTIVKKILNFRANRKKYTGNKKLYVHKIFEEEICKIFEEEINLKNFKTRESNDVSYSKFIRTKRSGMLDYADAFIRYLRATKLVTFEKRTYRLIISPFKKDEVEFILKNIDKNIIEFKNLVDFKNYLFNPESVKLLSDDKNKIISKIKNLGLQGVDDSKSPDELLDILDELNITIQSKNIENQKKELKDYSQMDDILKVFEKIKNRTLFDPSLFLEWNVWRALVMLNYAKRVDGNFIVDIDGSPLNNAPGQKPDIESEFSEFGLITEVTLSSGHTQYRMENESVPRHFGVAKSTLGKEMYCIFIAPNISDGTLSHFFNLNRMYTKFYGGKTKIIPLSIDNFIQFIKSGISNNFNNPKKLQIWLEKQWELNQKINDETEWLSEVNKSVKIWAE